MIQEQSYRDTAHVKKFFVGCLLLSLCLITGAILLFTLGDSSITSSLRSFSLEHPLCLRWASLLSQYGNFLYYLLFAAFFLYGMIRKEQKLTRITLVYLILQLVVSLVLTKFLKVAFGRPRPGYGSVRHSFSGKYRFESFPSGHTVDAFTSAGVLWGFLSSYLLSLLSFLFSLLIGLSRIFLGAHYFLDVLTGMGLGFAAGTVATFRFFRQMPKKVSAQHEAGSEPPV